MPQTEQKILAIFRTYRAGPNEMLFLNQFMDDQFLGAMDSLIESGLVVKDRREHAYHLTRAGYIASLRQ